MGLGEERRAIAFGADPLIQLLDLVAQANRQGVGPPLAALADGLHGLNPFGPNDLPPDVGVASSGAVPPRGENSHAGTQRSWHSPRGRGYPLGQGHGGKDTVQEAP